MKISGKVITIGMSLNFMTTAEVNFTGNTSISVVEVEDVKELAKSFLMHKIGKFLQHFLKYYIVFLIIWILSVLRWILQTVKGYS